MKKAAFLYEIKRMYMDVCLVMKKSTTGPQCTQTRGGTTAFAIGNGTIVTWEQLAAFS